MKIHVIHLAFDRDFRVAKTVNRFKDSVLPGGVDVEQTIVACRYPLPNPSLNCADMLGLSRYLGTSFLDLKKNFGQDGNYSRIRIYLSDAIADDDVVVFYDTDNRFDKNTWLVDAIKVFKADPSIGFICTNCSCTDNTLANQGAYSTHDGVLTREICWPGGWSTGIYRGSFYKKGHAITRDFYGGSEYNILQALRNCGMRGAMLADHDDLRDVEGWDPLYVQWKHEMITKVDQRDFEQWLKEKGHL